MALYIPRSIFHLARLLYVRPENYGPYHVRLYVGKAISELQIQVATYVF